MKIISINNSKQVTCDNCKSVLEYNGYDIHTHRIMMRKVDREWIVCPVCGREIDIE